MITEVWCNLMLGISVVSSEKYIIISKDLSKDIPINVKVSQN
jgi:hypothetical protein